MPISNVIAISAGSFHSAALKADGTLWEWGEGVEGQLGNGKLENQYSPVQVPIADVKAITSGHSVTLALKNDGTLWSWGHNSDYCLGNVTTDERQATPIKANGISDMIAISADGPTLVLKSDGTVWHWGREGMYPVMMKNLSGITAISAGGQHSLALKNDGTVWAWGSDDSGQLGDGGKLAVVVGPDGVIRDLNGTIRHPSSIIEDGPVQAYIGTQTGPAHVNSTSAIRPTPEPYEFPVDAAIAPINASAKVMEKWKLQNNGRIDYLGAGDDGLLYAFSNNNITSLSPDGVPRWNVTIPAKWRICSDWNRIMSLDMNTGMSQFVMSQPIYDSEDGYLYVYATPNSPLLDPFNFSAYSSANNTSGLSWAVLAITPDGRIGWELPLTTNITRYDTTSIKAYGGRVYVFHDYSETVLDRNGSILFTIPNVSDPAAVDENGRLYVSQALRVNWAVNDLGGDAGHSDFRVASGLIKAYDAGGRQLWQKDVGGIIPVQYVVEEVRQKYGSMPLYQDGIVYVPVSNGVIALDGNGNEKWSKHFENDGFRFFDLMPLDIADNVYLACYNLTYPSVNEATDIYMIDRNGTLVAPPRTLKISYDGARHSSAKDGIVYNIEMDWDRIGRSTSMDDIATATIRAYDIKGDRYLWNYTLPTDPRYTIVLDASNVYTLFDSITADQYVKGGSGQANTATPQIVGSTWVYTYPTDGTLYINFKSMRYEWPVVFGKTQCLYTSGIYALDTSGFVVCQKPVGSIITAMAVNNSTIYYSTGDGGISAMTIGIVASVIAIGAAFILLVGYIARSRSRLEKNKNRASVMEYITQNPGSTLYELSHSYSA